MKFDGTTVIAVRKNGETAMAGDGQVTFGNTVMKATARKVRSIYDGRVLVGFAGSTADAFTLFERFEVKVKEYSGDITRASVELAKEWRTDKMLRQLEAMLIVADQKKLLLLTGTGDVVEPDEGVTAIGSGGPYAYAAALAFMEQESYAAREVAEKAMRIASKICIYTNENFVIEEIV